MCTINIDFNERLGKIKPMHSVNNGPAQGPGKLVSNFESFKELEIPYVRNHDASLSEPYGCQHVVDVHCIFPDFSKDENDEKNYDFTMTDVYNKIIIEAGSKVFYRLGSSIEHWKRKYGTVLPVDFEKWARICEHIIMHYNEGWANGYNMGIEYWEIWNEADLDPDDATNKRTWGGTKKQFFEFYDVVAKYLKNRFPNLKIGGPASCGNLGWAEDFIAQLDAPLDFFSYHMYAYEPQFMAEFTAKAKNMLKKYGYGDTETILNEWNYVRDWGDPQEYIQAIHGMKGAAFVAATMCAVQNGGNLDMLMYYDCRQRTPWNGMFDFYTLKPLKGYYPFKMFSTLYKLGTQVRSECDDGDVIVTSATDGNTCATMITYYALDEDKAEAKTVKINTGVKMTCYLLDEDNDMQEIDSINDGDEIKMKPNSVVFLTAII